MRFLQTLILAAFAATSAWVDAAPKDFSQAKRILREHVYQDQNLSDAGDFYCGCKWAWVGRSGGRMDQESCGFQTEKMADRASRLEWEHVLPASTAAQHRQCWRNGGRENCQRTDPEFNRMEADMFNLVPSIGTANGLRSNINFGMVTGPTVPLGACTTKIGTTVRAVEPRNEVKGEAARITFYMADRYGIRLSERQERVLIAWDRAFPVSAWEKERNRRIAYSMGHHNPFVTGEKKWVPGYKPSGISQQATGGFAPVAVSQTAKGSLQESQGNVGGPVYGNKRSGVYHLPQGCPSYSQISARNRVEFGSEAGALAAGYRKAGNCN